MFLKVFLEISSSIDHPKALLGEGQVKQDPGPQGFVESPMVYFPEGCISQTSLTMNIF